MISTRLKKVSSDFVLRWGRTLLTLGGLGFGLFGLGAVITALVMLASDLNAEFRRTDPPQVTVVATGEVLPATLARLSALAGVTAVERRDAFSGRIETAPGHWMPLEVFVVDDFRRQQVAKFRAESGAWPPADGGVLIERGGADFLEMQAGQPVNLRLGDGRPVTATLAGLAYDPGQPQSRMEGVVYGYAGRGTLGRWGLKLDRTRLLFRVDTRRASVEAVARQATATLATAGVTVERIEAQASPEHPHQFQIDAILALLAGVGVMSLVMCVVLMINLVESVMANEQKAIGVMKALGARSGQITRDYLMAAGLLGLVAAGLAAAPALSMGRSVAQFVAMMANFKQTTDGRPPALAAILLVGTLVPVLVAFGRVRRTASLSIRQALSRPDSVGSTALAEGVGRWFSALPLIPLMALRTLLRRPRRALLTGLTLALGLSFFITALDMRASLLETVNTVQRTKPADLMLSLRQAYAPDALAAWVRAQPGVRRLEFWTAASGTLSDSGPSPLNPLPILAIPAKAWAIRPDMIAGRWLDPATPDGVVASQKLIADQPWLKLGGRYILTIGARSVPVRLTGVAREFSGAVLYAPQPLIQGLTGAADRSNLVLVGLDDHSFAAQRRAAGQIETAAENQPWSLSGVVASGQVAAIVLGHIDLLGKLLLIIAGLAVAIGAAGLASAISVSVVERRGEIGVLKAVGARQGAVAGLFVWEAVFIGLIGWALALAAAPFLSRGLTWTFGTMIIGYPFDFRAAALGPLAALGAAMIIAVGASLPPVRSALNTTIYKALRAE